MGVLKASGKGKFHTSDPQHASFVNMAEKQPTNAATSNGSSGRKRSSMAGPHAMPAPLDKFGDNGGSCGY